MAANRVVRHFSPETQPYDLGAPTTQFVLACLRAQWDADSLAAASRLAQADDFSWDQVRALVQAERIAPLLYRAVCGQDWFPDDLLQECRGDYILTATRNTLLLQELEHIISLLTNAGLPVIPLKGAALVNTVYSTVAVRPMFDLDILVETQRAGAVIGLLEQWGYTRVAAEPRTGTMLDYENEVTLVKNGAAMLPLEVHWSLIDSPYYQRVLDMEWFWETSLLAQIGRSPARFLSVEATLLHLCAHLALHHRGVGLLWLHDVAALIQANSHRIDWATVVRQTERFGLAAAVRSALMQVHVYWHTPLPEIVLTQLAALPINEHEARALALATTPPDAVAQRFVQDIVGLSTWRQRGDFVMRNLFPSPEYMRWRYAIAHGWQTPFYYPYRWFLGIVSALRNHE